MDDQFINSLPPNVGRVLAEFIEQARSAFADDLRAIVLYAAGRTVINTEPPDRMTFMSPTYVSRKQLLTVWRSA